MDKIVKSEIPLQHLKRLLEQAKEHPEIKLASQMTLSTVDPCTHMATCRSVILTQIDEQPTAFLFATSSNHFS